MHEGNARRRLDKKLDTRIRDRDGSTGNPRGFHKAVRTYGKVLIDTALEDMALEQAEHMEPCIMCGKPCVKLCCTNNCYKEAISIGLIPPEKTA